VRGGTLTEEDFWCSPVYARLTGRDTSNAGPPQHTGPSNQLPDITKMVVVTNLKQAKLHVTPELQQQVGQGFERRLMWDCVCVVVGAGDVSLLKSSEGSSCKGAGCHARM
jgi:hypothetical protein